METYGPGGIRTRSAVSLTAVDECEGERTTPWPRMAGE